MSGDLVIHSSLLDDLKRTFSTITHQMYGVQRTLRNVDAVGVGDSKLAGDLQDYADDWSYGITQIGQHADATVKMIDQVGKTFSDVDVKLANALKKPGERS